MQHAQDSKGQSRAMSMVEAVTNVVVGYLLALGVQAALFPLLGLEVGLTDNLLIGVAFTVVSLARTFMLRRLFESFRVRR
jgi:hypothetical protein